MTVVKPLPITLPKVADLRAEFLRSKKNPLTREAYESDFRAFTVWRDADSTSIDEALHDWLLLTPQDARQVAEDWKQSMASSPDSTIRRRMSTLRGFSKWIHADGALPWVLAIDNAVDRSEEQMADATPRDMDGPPEQALAKARAVLQEDGSPNARRLLAIFDLLYFRGLRISEVLRIDVNQFDPELSQVTIRGKARKQQETVKIDKEAVRSIQWWLAVRPGPRTGPLFVRFDRAAKPGEMRLSRTTVANELDELRARIKYKKRFRPHGLRHSAIDAVIQDATAEGRPLTQVQKWARHKSYNTTAGYAKRLEGDEEEINARLAKRLREAG